MARRWDVDGWFFLHIKKKRGLMFGHVANDAYSLSSSARNLDERMIQVTVSSSFFGFMCNFFRIFFG